MYLTLAFSACTFLPCIRVWVVKISTPRNFTQFTHWMPEPLPSLFVLLSGCVSLQFAGLALLDAAG
jgi:hypothetical protein